MNRDPRTPLCIDDTSDPGAWQDAIDHTPSLAANTSDYLPDAAPDQEAQRND